MIKHKNKQGSIQNEIFWDHVTTKNLDLKKYILFLVVLTIFLKHYSSLKLFYKVQGEVSLCKLWSLGHLFVYWMRTRQYSLYCLTNTIKKLWIPVQKYFRQTNILKNDASVPADCGCKELACGVRISNTLYWSLTIYNHIFKNSHLNYYWHIHWEQAWVTLLSHLPVIYYRRLIVLYTGEKCACLY